MNKHQENACSLAETAYPPALDRGDPAGDAILQLRDDVDHAGIPGTAADKGQPLVAKTSELRQLHPDPGVHPRRPGIGRDHFRAGGAPGQMGEIPQAGFGAESDPNRHD